MHNFLIVLMLSCLFMACEKENKYKVDVSHIPVSIDIERFDVDFYTTTAQTLATTKEKHPMFFPHNVDSVWIHKLQDKDEQELYAETQKVYKSVDFLKNDLKQLFKYVSYYNPKIKIPKVFTMLTNIDYDNRIVLADEFLLISLDAYLGGKHPFYNDYPAYVKQNNTKQHIIVDVANTIIDKQIPKNRERKFLNKMIAEGKRMYLLDCYLPQTPDYLKIGYTEEKFKWSVKGEETVWKYFIERDLLYSTSSKLDQRFLNIAPFSKFYLATDNQSPGRIGVYIGWQIVRSFMKNNDVSLDALMQMSEEVIFKKSKYKPKR